MGRSKKDIAKILSILDERYPDHRCHLVHGNAWQLLFATIMSAQCTDKRVNMITETLFVKYPSLEAFAEVSQEELEEDIKQAGFYHDKALHIRQSAQMLLTEYGGVVPSDIEELTKLPGVGRKTANVVRSHIFGIPSIVVDTHVKRVSKLLGITDTLDPVKAEFELMKALPEDHWSRYNVQVINLGREICISGRPACEACPLCEVCKKPNFH